MKRSRAKLIRKEHADIYWDANMIYLASSLLGLRILINSGDISTHMSSCRTSFMCLQKPLFLFTCPMLFALFKHIFFQLVSTVDLKSWSLVIKILDAKPDRRNTLWGKNEKLEYIPYCFHAFGVKHELYIEPPPPLNPLWVLCATWIQERLFLSSQSFSCVFVSVQCNPLSAA